MPLYTYKCNECNHIFDIFHGMSEEHNECASCNKKDCLERLPPEFLSNLNKETKDAKVGTLVESHIRESRLELEKEKKSLKNKNYV